MKDHISIHREIENGKAILYADCFVSLAIGAFIYLLMKPDTYIAEIVLKHFSLPCVSHNSLFMIIIFNWACDLLWAHSFVIALYLCVSKLKHAISFSFFITVICGAIYEVLQLFHVVSGTFDVLDVLAEFAGAVISIATVKIVLNGGENVKKAVSLIMVIIVIAMFAFFAIASGSSDSSTSKATKDDGAGYVAQQFGEDEDDVRSQASALAEEMK